MKLTDSRTGTASYWRDLSLFTWLATTESTQEHMYTYFYIHQKTNAHTQEHRVLLTGTPLQNSVEELFSLLNFLEPNKFPSHIAFLQQFGDLKTEEQVEELKLVSV